LNRTHREKEIGGIQIETTETETGIETGTGIETATGTGITEAAEMTTETGTEIEIATETDTGMTGIALAEIPEDPQGGIISQKR